MNEHLADLNGALINLKNELGDLSEDALPLVDEECMARMRNALDRAYTALGAIVEKEI